MTAVSQKTPAPDEIMRNACALLERGEYGDALVLFRQLEQIIPSNAPGYNRVRALYGLTLVGLGSREEGLAVCQEAARGEFNDARVFHAFARAALLCGRRQLALKAISMGRVIDGDHSELEALRQKMGVRQKPVIKFLSRNNPINIALGRKRHRRAQQRAH